MKSLFLKLENSFKGLLKMWKLKNRKGTAENLVSGSLPYWEALKNDDIEAWNALPKVESLWLLTDDNLLIEDTCWTAAAKTGAINCLNSWNPDKQLHCGQQIWGSEEHGLGVKRGGGGNVLHSISSITFEPKINYLIQKWIKEHGVKVNQKNVDGLTPLHTCAAHGHAAGVEALMQTGADITNKSKTGATPLEYAVKMGTFETTKKLLAWGGWNVDREAKDRVLEASLSARLQEPMEMLFLVDGFFVEEAGKEHDALFKWKELRAKVGRKVTGLEYRNAEKLIRQKNQNVSK